MKIKVSNILLCVALSITLFSCDLNRNPKDYIQVDKSLSTLLGLSYWDNGTMVTLRSRMYGEAVILPQEVQADMLNMHVKQGSPYTQFHGWQELRASNTTISGLYHAYYVALADVNVLLDAIEKFDISKEGNPEVAQQKLDIFAGNAHFARAFYYFNLAIRWGQPYKEATATQDDCIPLLKKNDPLTKYPRAKNAEVWNFILDELTLAEKQLASLPAREGADYLTSSVATALKARVYLYMGKMPEALKEAEKVISNKAYTLVGKDETSGQKESVFELMWHGDSGREQIFQPFVSKPNEIPGGINLYGANLAQHEWWKQQGASVGNTDPQFNNPPFMPAGWLNQLYSENDKRRNVYFEFNVSTLFGSTRSQVAGPLFVISKFKGNKKYSELTSKHWGGYVPNGIQAPKPFRLAEIYLIASEAACESGNSSKATEYLNALKVSRGLTEVNLSDTELRDEIRNERTRELAFEGFRLWDLRRWGVGVKRHTPQEPKKVLSSEYDLNMTIPASDYHFVWGIPIDLFKINKLLTQNEGWEH